eukprot:scaffold27430_cov112-Isochrysis_galbana.AAC.2
MGAGLLVPSVNELGGRTTPLLPLHELGVPPVLGGGLIEREEPRKHGKEGHTERPDVRSKAIVPAAVENLRRGIRFGAAHVGEASRPVEVAVGVALVHHVLELQITVCHAVFVAVVDTGEQFAHEAACHVLRHCIGAPIDHLIEQLATACALHEDEVKVVLGRRDPARAMPHHPDHIGVLELLENSTLLSDRLDPHATRVDDLHSQRLTSRLGNRSESRAIPTLTKLFGLIDREGLEEPLSGGVVGRHQVVDPGAQCVQHDAGGRRRAGQGVDRAPRSISASKRLTPHCLSGADGIASTASRERRCRVFNLGARAREHKTWASGADRT